MSDLSFIGQQIPEEEGEAVTAVLLLFVLLFIESGGRLQGECRSLFFPFRPCHQPALLHLLFGVYDVLRGGVGYMEPVSVPFLPDVIAHHEVVLVPVQDARQRHVFLQLLQGNTHSRCAEPDGFRRVTDAQHGYPLACDEGALAERLQRIVLAVIFGYHPQTGGAAVHRIQLEVVGDIFFRVVKHISCRWLYLLMLIIIRTLFGREGYVNHHTSCPGFFPVFQFSNGIFSFFY